MLRFDDRRLARKPLSLLHFGLAVALGSGALGGAPVQSGPPPALEPSAATDGAPLDPNAASVRVAQANEDSANANLRPASNPDFIRFR